MNNEDVEIKITVDTSDLERATQELEDFQSALEALQDTGGLADGLDFGGMFDSGGTDSNWQDVLNQNQPQDHPYADYANYPEYGGPVNPDLYGSVEENVYPDWQQYTDNPAHYADTPLQKSMAGASGSSAAAKPQQAANYVYAPNIQTAANAQEVFNVLSKHSRQFFGMVAEGIKTDSTLRNTVRGA